MRRPLRITVDLSALRHNLTQLRSLAPDLPTFAVIKADAYGHGAPQVATALSDLTTGFAVVTPEEGVELREAGIKNPILVMQGVREGADWRVLENAGLMGGIHRPDQIDSLRAHIDAGGQTVGVWLKFDTGMGRLGLNDAEAAQWLAEVQGIAGVQVKGVMTHFACADEPTHPATPAQLARIDSHLATLNSELSLANSAALLHWPEARRGWLRPGIALYGANPAWPIAAPVDLRPAMTATAPIISVRRHARGATIGYGNTYTCQEDSVIAYVACGYGDGYPRHVATDTPVLINATRCPIVGRVSMDSIAVDVTHVDGVSEGVIATLWGEGLPVEEIADRAGTISYELTCQIRGRREYRAG